MGKAMRPKTMKEILKEEELEFNIRLCDMGNACYIDKHYSDLIQTREYRSPEVLLNGEYDESADLWSLACMVFELVTGDYLFDPKKGKTFKKSDDHLALITELIGEMDPRETEYYRTTCDLFDDFYIPSNSKKTKFKLERIKSLKPWPLQKVLTDKYKMKPIEAELFSKFLMRMLKWVPSDRVSARELLDDAWLKVSPDEGKQTMSRAYFNEWNLCQGKEANSSSEDESDGSEDDEQEGSDSEQDDDEEWQSDDQDDEDADVVQDDLTANQTLMNTVPDATGLCYDPKGATIYTEN